MPNTNPPSFVRRWQRLGKTVLDMRHVVKIEFGRGEARLFVVAGEALLMTAWTESRGEIAELKQLAAHANRWVSVAEEARLSDGDDSGAAEYAAGSNDSSGRDGDEDGDRYGDGAADDYSAARPAPVSNSDARVRLASVDRLVYIDTAAGGAVELFASGVFLGRVTSAEDLDDIETYVGQ